MQRRKGLAAAVAAHPTKAIGGPRRVRAIGLLALVLALDAADKGTVGAVAPQLEHALRLSNTQLGLLTAAPAGMGALGAIPAGMLTDRVRRVPLLGGSVLLWSAAMAADESRLTP